MSFGSADYKIYCYDLRNANAPWCVLAGHEKAVSYVKFVDSATLVSASTDNTLKLWDLSRTSSTSLSNNACSLTLGGHKNEKVGNLCFNEYCCLSLYNEISFGARILAFLLLLGIMNSSIQMLYQIISVDVLPLILQNFVGLSVADGYIACGSETNEVIFYFSLFRLVGL